MQLAAMALLAANSLRLQRANYPLQFEWSPRWSDLEGGQVSRVGFAQFFEDTRAAMMQVMLGPDVFVSGRWNGVLGAITVEFLAPARFGEPLLCVGGFDAIGRSSYGHALAIFQGDRCVALSHCTGVNFGMNTRATPLDDEMRRRLQRYQWAAPEIVAPQGNPPWRSAVTSYPVRLQWPTRISDTDFNRHVNNVALVRYLDNALMAFRWDGNRVGGTRAEDCRWEIGRVMVSLRAESFHPAPICSTLAVTHIGEQGFEIAQALFQGDRCTATADVSIELCGAGNEALSIPEALRERLRQSALLTIKGETQAALAP